MPYIHKPIEISNNRILMESPIILKKPLVVGANGYIGRHLVHALLRNNLSPIVADIQPTSHDSVPGYAQLDATSAESVLRLIQHNEPDVVFWLVGMTGTAQGFDAYERYLQINELSTLNVLNALRMTHSRAKLVFPSSRLVYRGQKDRRLAENDPKECKTLYAANKQACEAYLGMYSNVFGLKHTILRICVPYGCTVPGNLSFGTVSHFLSQAQKKQDITLFGDGMQKRTFTYITDIVENMIRAAAHHETDNKIFNIGGPDTLTIREAAEKIAKVYGVHVQFGDWPEIALKIESGDTIFNDSKLQKILNYKYTMTFDSWIAQHAKRPG